MSVPPKIRRGGDPAPAGPATGPETTPAPAATPPRVMHGDDTLSPVDLPGSRTIGGRPLLWASGAIYLAALFLLLTNASVISGWAGELPPNALTARIATLANGWEAATGRLGLGAPHATMHGWWKAAQAARFGSERAE